MSFLSLLPHTICSFPLLHSASPPPIYGDHGFSSDPFWWSLASPALLAAGWAASSQSRSAVGPWRRRGACARFLPPAGSHTCSLVPVTAARSPPWNLITRSLRNKETGNVRPRLPGNYGDAQHLSATKTTPIRGSRLILGGGGVWASACVCLRL